MSMKDLIFGSSGAKDTGSGSGSFHGSIQEWLPIKNILGGVVITKDNRFVINPLLHTVDTKLLKDIVERPVS